MIKATETEEKVAFVVIIFIIGDISTWGDGAPGCVYALFPTGSSTMRALNNTDNDHEVIKYFLDFMWILQKQNYQKPARNVLFKSKNIKLQQHHSKVSPKHFERYNFFFFFFRISSKTLLR